MPRLRPTSLLALLALVGAAAANRVSWQTPATLAEGTYAYSCRVNPFLGGAFRVTGA